MLAGDKPQSIVNMFNMTIQQIRLIPLVYYTIMSSPSYGSVCYKWIYGRNQTMQDRSLFILSYFLSKFEAWTIECMLMYASWSARSGGMARSISNIYVWTTECDTQLFTGSLTESIVIHQCVRVGNPSRQSHGKSADIL